jgi:Haem-dependent oxidative N-demethylase, alpha subunit-like
MTEILQTQLPYDPLTPRPLPGISAMLIEDWLHHDEAFKGQMARRDQLLADSSDDVVAMDDQAKVPAQELLDLVLAQVYPDSGSHVVRADGVRVEVDYENPLLTLGRLVQEDFCILQKQGDEHVLTGAVLCFPASWTLSEKFMRPLIGIHDGVDSYDSSIARRVQRLFDGVQVGKPMWRFNALWYRDAELHQPRSFLKRRVAPEQEAANYLRSERQCILRLSQSGAVIFSIHTYVLARQDVPGA